MKERGDAALEEMLANAERVLEWVARAGPRWFEDPFSVDAIGKRVEQVAEIAKYQFPLPLRRDYPQIDWDLIAGARDKFVHEYRYPDIRILRDIVESDIPRLIETLRDLGFPPSGLSRP